MIKEINKKYNITNVVVSHDIISAQRIATDIVFIYKGKIIFSGSPSVIKEVDDPIIKKFFAIA
jgi:phospholipid/cholesterol/gamma-HCH transport system ATP-binding protein